MQLRVVIASVPNPLISPSTIQQLPGSLASGIRPLIGRRRLRKLQIRLVSYGLLLTVLLPYIGMHMLGVRSFSWFQLSIVPWDFAILASGALIMLLVVTHGVRVPERLPLVFFLIGALVVWFAIEAARSPTPFRGWTMVLLLIRDVVMFAAVYLAVRRRPTLQSLNLWISVIGLAVVGAAIPLFLMNVNTYSERLPFDGVIVLFEGVTPRMIGFAVDPNFFGWVVAVPLMTLPFATRIPLPLRWLAAAVLITAIFFTGSRLLPFSVFVGTATFTVAMLWLKQRSVVRQLLTTLVPGLLIALAVMPVWFMGPSYPSSLGTRLFERYSLGTATPRNDLWSQTLAGIGSGDATEPSTQSWVLRALIGNGLRSNQENLFGSYSHNTYLDLLGETGLIGMLVWLAITGTITVQGVRAVRSTPSLTPWLVVWLMTLVFFYGFSLLVAPYYWFVAAVISGGVFSRVSLVDRKVTQQAVPLSASPHGAK